MAIVTTTGAQTNVPVTMFQRLTTRGCSLIRLHLALRYGCPSGRSGSGSARASPERTLCPLLSNGFPPVPRPASVRRRRKAAVHAMAQLQQVRIGVLLHLPSDEQRSRHPVADLKRLEDYAGVAVGREIHYAWPITTLCISAPTTPLVTFQWIPERCRSNSITMHTTLFGAATHHNSAAARWRAWFELVTRFNTFR